MVYSGKNSQLLREDRQLIQIVDAAFADAARRSGEHLVCRPGCTQCCHGAFAIDALDAFRLRAGMESLAVSDPVLATAIEKRTIRYLEDFGAGFPGDVSTGILATSEEAHQAFEDFANDAACPALNPETGLCDVYDWRPMTCRVFGPPIRSEVENAVDEALAVCELCFTRATAEEIAEAEMYVPHQEEENLARDVEAAGEQAGETIVAYCLTPRRNELD